MSNESAIARVETPQLTGLEILTGQSPVYNTLDMKTERGQNIYLAAMVDPDYKVSEMINRQLDICDIIAHQVELPDDDTGEVSLNTRIILVDIFDKTYGCVSWWVARSISAIVGAKGPPPWTPSIKVEVVQKEIAGGKRRLLLKFVGGGQPVSAKKSK